MEEKPQTAQNQTENNTDEFAQKEPLVKPETVQKILRTVFLSIGILVILLAGIFAYNLITGDRGPSLIDDPVVIEPEPVNQTDPAKDYFAYIKNDQVIWISDTEGEEKFTIVELPVTSSSRIVSLDWKDKNNLGHSVCDESSCEILSYNFETRSVRPELSTNSQIKRFSWNENQTYLAYIETQGQQTRLRLKTGTIDNILKEVPRATDETNTKTSVLFTSDSQYVIYYTLRRPDSQFDNFGREIQSTEPAFPVIYVFQVNGVQVDEIQNASDPFLIDGTTLAYKRSGELVYKTIGTTEESLITAFQGYNPQISFDNRNIAYWRDELGFNSVVLGVYDSQIGIHRNILRGIVLPTWVGPSRVAGIKADSCMGDRCLLYEFQTASLVLVDISSGDVINIDQGQTISEIAFYTQNAVQE